MSTINESIISLSVNASVGSITEVFNSLTRSERIDLIDLGNSIVDDRKHSMRKTIVQIANIKKFEVTNLKKSLYTFLSLWFNTENNENDSNKYENTFIEVLENNMVDALKKAQKSKVAIINEHLIKQAIKGLIVVYARRSDLTQSDYTEDDIVKAIFDLYDEDRTIIVFADDSSSFKDFTFFRALEIANVNKSPIEIYSPTRSEIETICRSEYNMRLYIKYIEDNVMFNVVAMGLNLYYMSSLVLFITSLNEGKWLANANTQLYDKHKLYYKAVKDLDLKILNHDEKKEVTALLKSNMGQEGTITFFETLANKKIASLKRQIKKLKKDKFVMKTIKKLKKKVNLSDEELKVEIKKREILIKDVNDFFFSE